MKLRVFILGVALILLGACSQIDAYFGGKKETLNQTVAAFYIPTGTKLEELINALEEQNIINDRKSFQALLDYKEFSDAKIGYGKYLIQPNTNYNTLINGFTKNSLGNGNQEVEVEVTFNNCKNVYDIAGKVAQQIEMDSTAFIEHLLAAETLNKYGFSEAKIGALFLPNTYRFFWDTDHEQFIGRMAEEFKKFWTPLRMEKLSEIGLKSQSEAVTLASIVYKEQDKHAAEWKTIAGLYLNRLRRGMKLESDPTFRYCWGDELDGVERLLYIHRDRDCPYNTYLYAGLPPGPIYIPPSQVVDAVLNAEKNDYLFMCAKPELSGLHNFAVTLAQHNRNAAEFQRWISQQQRNKR